MDQGVDVLVNFYVGWQGLPGNRDRVAWLQRVARFAGVPPIGSTVVTPHGPYPVKSSRYDLNGGTPEVVIEEVDENDQWLEFEDDDECDELIAEIVEMGAWVVKSDGIFPHVNR